MGNMTKGITVIQLSLIELLNLNISEFLNNLISKYNQSNYSFVIKLLKVYYLKLKKNLKQIIFIWISISII